MIHDPLCAALECGCSPDEECGPACIHNCRCDLIAKVEARARQHDGCDTEHATGYDEGFSAGLDAAAEAVRAAGHTPFGVYDECECPEDVREQDGHGIELEDFYGCEKSRLYDVCRFCCSENDYHTEACATGHHHGPDKPYCTAVAAIDALRGDSC